MKIFKTTSSKGTITLHQEAITVEGCMASVTVTLAISDSMIAVDDSELSFFEDKIQRYNAEKQVELAIERLTKTRVYEVIKI